ncbi:hypothetical protein [Nocardia brasiliensis]|uniref:hypothetical protein n=1 Tax=Nocardia brasiliensis TaxID=37326 RepID=UPI0033F7F995
MSSDKENETPVRIGGKTFTRGLPPLDPDLIAQAMAMSAEMDRERAAMPVGPTPSEPGTALPERFHDDCIGTEYEPWYRDLQAKRARERQQHNDSGE